MDILKSFLNRLTADQRKIFTGLKTPALIQEFLDDVPYRIEDDNFCALSVFRDGKAHCFDGSMFAAAALRQIGYESVVIQLLPENDDDHMLAVYKKNNRFGAVGKSNYTGLRSRQPVYKTIHELVMSYFEDFYNLDSMYSLRGYTLPIRLKAYDRYDWMSSDQGVQTIVKRLYQAKKVRLFTPEILADVAPIDPISFRSGMSITNLSGAFKPGVSPNHDFGF